MKRLWFAVLLLAAAAVSAADGKAPRSAPTGHVAIASAPAGQRMKDTGLKEGGLRAADRFPYADEVRVFPSLSETNRAPAARIWVNSGEGGRYWFQAGGRGSAEDYLLPAGAAVVIVRRGLEPDRGTPRAPSP